MKFFSLSEHIRQIISIEAEDTSEEDKASGTSLSTTVLKSLSIPATVSASIPIYSYIKNNSIPSSSIIELKLDKLSDVVSRLLDNKTLIPSTTPSETTGTSLPKQDEVWSIPKGEGKSYNIDRKSPSDLGLVGQLPSRGTYTKDEASYILALKSKGIDTSASKTRMHTSIESLIRNKAAEYGVDQDIAVKIAVVESGGNPNAISTTGAIGIYQFTGATANLMGLNNRFNVEDNIDAGIRLIRADKKFVGKFNSEIATYLALQIGGPNAKYVLTSDPSTKISDLPPSIRSTVRGNMGGSSVTVGDYLSINARALNEKLEQQKSKPEFLFVSPLTNSISSSTPSASMSPSSIMYKAPNSTLASKSFPTTKSPTYSSSYQTPTSSSSTDTEYGQKLEIDSTDRLGAPSVSDPVTRIDGLVRHKSGLYFNVS